MVRGAELLQEYRATLVAAGRAPNTIYQRIGDVERFRAVIGDLCAVRGEDLTSYFAAHKAWKPEYRKNVATSLRQFYTWAHGRGSIAEDITTYIPHVPVPRQALPPAPEEVLEAALRNARHNVRAILLLGATLGMRRTEIATAHPRHRAGRVLTVTGKNGKGRRIPLDDMTMAALDDLESRQSRDVYYFPGRSGDGHLHPCTIYKWVRAALGSGWSTHSLRRRAGKQGFERTKDIRAVQGLLGHESLSTTALYVHIDEDDMARVTAATSFQTQPQPEPTPAKRSDMAALLAEIVDVTARAAAVGLNVRLSVE